MWAPLSPNSAMNWPQRRNSAIRGWGNLPLPRCAQACQLSNHSLEASGATFRQPDWGPADQAWMFFHSMGATQIPGSRAKTKKCRMKDALPEANSRSSIWRRPSASRPRRTKGRSHRPKRRVAPVVGAALLAATIFGTWTAYPHAPELLASTGAFFWGIKSSVVELVLAVVVARLPKHH